jgi:hypothetical protein
MFRQNTVLAIADAMVGESPSAKHCLPFLVAATPRWDAKVNERNF